MTAAALVIGGGPAGAALALQLSAAGREVVLCERDAAAAHKVCGEFISCEAAEYLAALGVDLVALGAVPITALRLCARDLEARIELPFAALSLSRRVLDQALLERASRAGARVLRNTKVSSLRPEGRGFSAQLAQGPELRAQAAFLATGKHDLRQQRRPSGLHNDLVAFKLHLQLTADNARALQQHVELGLFDGGYAGLQPVEGGLANLCLVIRRSRLQALGQRWPAVLAALRAECQLLEARLRDAVPCWARPLAVSSIPYGHVCTRPHGIWRLGDQAAVIPSFAGDGIAIALHSAELASASYLAGDTPEAYQQRLARDLRSQVYLATLLSRAIVRPGWQPWLASIARHWPALVTALARRTRVSEAALKRARAA